MKKQTIQIITILLLSILCFPFIYNSLTFSENFDDTVGFIITRHVNSEKTNNYWIECVNQIRTFYPNNPIAIIDDNSNYDFVKNDGVNLYNVTIIQSEYPQRGEFLPYYYLYKKQLFNTAVFFHDSVYIVKPIDVDSVNNVKFLWDFESKIKENPEREKEMLSVMNYSNELIKFYEDEIGWKGCWGAMSIINYDFLKTIYEKYNFDALLNQITSRTDRMCFERIFGLVCIFENKQLLNEPSVDGDAMQYFSKYQYINFDNYIENKNTDYFDGVKIIKVFSGR
jgi:hypothetical protein